MVVSPLPSPEVSPVQPAVGVFPTKPRHKPGNTFRDCPECPEMVVISPGSFRMGSDRGKSWERPAHWVTIGYAFALGKFEITFAEWDACVEQGGCRHRPHDAGWGRGRRPVMNVNREDMAQFLDWLSRKTGNRYRFPTEAEWEYAARAGTTTRYLWGDNVGENNANCNGCGSKWDDKKTAPVGSFAANAFGLHDVFGNVDEWLEDCWHDTYDGAPNDGSAWKTGGKCSDPVLRGNAWNDDAKILCLPCRGGYPSTRNHEFGLRVARDLD